MPNTVDGALGVDVIADDKVLGGDAGLAQLLSNAGDTGYVVTAASAGLPTTTIIHPNDLRFAPRVGWAWRPSINNSMVVRGSYGIFFTGSRLSALRTELAGNFPFSIVESP